MQKINLLVCDQFPGILPADIPSYEWMFERVFTLSDGETEFEVYQSWQGELPKSPNTSDIYLITGSNSGACDSTSWISNLRRWIRNAYSSGCKLAGICFGHQIIAQAFGGRVERSPKGWGVGLRESHVIDDTFHTMTGADSFTILYNHHDQVVELPGNATLVSESDFCPIESFRIGRQVLALQGHPEFQNAFVEHWINDCAPDEPQDVKKKALESMEKRKNQGIAVAGWILRFFQ